MKNMLAHADKGSVSVQNSQKSKVKGVKRSHRNLVRPKAIPKWNSYHTKNKQKKTVMA